MDMRCQICQTLTIEHLVNLAKTEFTSQKFPPKSHFKHHPSITALQASAASGCDLCTLFLSALLSYSYEPFLNPETLTSDGISFSVLDMACQRAHQSEVKLCLNTQHTEFGAGYDEVRMLDLLVLRVGNLEDDAWAGEEDEVYDFDAVLAPCHP
jgi:hypothetical protein